MRSESLIYEREGNKRKSRHNRQTMWVNQNKYESSHKTSAFYPALVTDKTFPFDGPRIFFRTDVL